jgi:L-galactose dehydrogenase/L-glyceraldehyde 3-phosphate reductase
MEYRTLGRTGIRVSEIGFGCGNVGGMMVRGSHDAQISAMRYALALGIDYFDTAALYGDGLSETHLGEVLKEIKPDVHVATKFPVRPEDLGDIPGSIRRSLEGSLTRLQLDAVDVFQLHTNLSTAAEPGLGAAEVLRAGGIADTLDALRDEGLIGHRGFTGMGDTGALHEVIESGRFDTVQIYYNLLNPSAGHAVPADYPNQDYRLTIDKAAAQNMGIIVIRALAGGAVSGPQRADLASRRPGGVMAAGNDYDSDLRRAEALSFLAAGERTVAQASIRFALDNPNVSTVLVGFSDETQIDDAAAAANGSPLSAVDMDRIRTLWASDFAT